MGVSGSQTALGTAQSTSQTIPQEITPNCNVLNRDLTSKITLYLRCEQLKKEELVMMALYSRCMQDVRWAEVGMTEAMQATECSPPMFKRTYTQPFRLEEPRILRLELYKVKDPSCLQDLRAQVFIGCIEASLAEVMMSRKKGNGWLVKPAMHPKLGMNKETKLCLYAEEEAGTKFTVAFDLSARQLWSTAHFKLRPDPYCVFNQTTARDHYGQLHVELSPVYRTEVRRWTGFPSWKRCELSVAQICNNDRRQDIVIEVSDWFRLEPERKIGEAITNFDEIDRHFNTSRPLVLPIMELSGERVYDAEAYRMAHRVATKDSAKRASTKDSARRKSRESMATKESVATTVSKRSQQTDASEGALQREAMMEIYGKKKGSLLLKNLGVLRRYSFPDFIRGGLEMKLIYAIDFSRSNGEIDDKNSLHYLDRFRPNCYEKTITCVGNALAGFQAADRFPVYGFGAKIPPSFTQTPGCFALSGDIFHPDVEGITGVLQAYKRALHAVRLHGPTQLADVVKLAAGRARCHKYAGTKDGSRIDMVFFVLLILTDGDIGDDTATLDAIVSASDVPLSIVIVGMGSEKFGDRDFTLLRDLPAEVRKFRQVRGESSELTQKRELIRFVEFDSASEGGKRLADACIGHIPAEVSNFYEANDILPRGLAKFEDEHGHPIMVPHEAKDKKADALARKKHQASKRSASRVSACSRTSTKSVTFKDAAPPGVDLAAANVGGTQSKPKEELTEEQKFNMWSETLSKYFKEELESFSDSAYDAGYQKGVIRGVIRRGVPSASLECFTDSLLNTGFGKSPTFKEAMSQVAIGDDVHGESRDTQPVSVALAGPIGAVPSQGSIVNPKLEAHRGQNSLVGLPNILKLTSSNDPSFAGDLAISPGWSSANGNERSPIHPFGPSTVPPQAAGFLPSESIHKEDKGNRILIPALKGSKDLLRAVGQGECGGDLAARESPVISARSIP